MSGTIAVVFMVIAAVTVDSQRTAFFTGRGIAFQTGNDGPTVTSTANDIISGLCNYMQPSEATPMTDPANGRTMITCSIRTSSAVLINNTVQYCEDAGKNCDFTVTWAYVGANGSALVAATTTAINTDMPRFITAFNNSMVRFVVGATMDRAPEDLQVITGFVVTLTVGYLAFSIVLLIAFCLVQHFYVNRD